MSVAEIRVRQAQLLELTVRLAEEFPDPGGTVMRCVARVVRSERRHGVAEDCSLPMPGRRLGRCSGRLVRGRPLAAHRVLGAVRGLPPGRAG